MKTAYVSPFTNSTNRYIELHKQLLADSGYEVKPLNLRTLSSADLWGLLRADNLITVHWLETRAFRTRGAGQRLWGRGVLEFALLAAVLALSRARLLYFVHDHAVHDTVGWQRSFSTRLVRLLCRLADQRVVHDPDSALRYDARYLPHPLYWDAPGGATPAAAAGPAAPRGDGAPAPRRFGLLGAVRPYKRIDSLLRLWPAGVPLLIRGRTEAAYAAQLQALIAERRLAPAVSFVPGQLSDADFDAAMASLDVLILPHADQSMLVSGAFFEAAGRVPTILARDSSFVRWAAARLPQVVAFDSDAALAEAVQVLAAAPATEAASPAASRQAALALFGWAECQRCYRHATASTAAA
jgi:beta-1,4-mannosyltransferase